MSVVKFHKVVNTLPSTLEADTLYLVKIGTGFDLYVTNNTGEITSYKINGGSGGSADLDGIDPGVLVGLNYVFNATFTNDSNGNPLIVLETGIGTNGRKRKTDFTYDSNQNVSTQEIRILQNDNTFIYGIRKVFNYSGNTITGITVTDLTS